MRTVDLHIFAQPDHASARVTQRMPPKMKRKLTTILCADAVGYASLMGADEVKTLERLQRYRGIMGELFERHEGRKVNTWGDAVIAEFSSVVEAVRCAVEIQDAIGAENASLPNEKSMRFRIGINLGDVMQDGGDLYGDGVNVAARLESLAEPGGILISRAVYDFTQRQLGLGFDFAGKLTAKDHDEPIEAYRIRMPSSNEPPRDAPGAAAAHVSVAATEPSTRLARLRNWYFGQPRWVRFPVSMIALFFTINLLTSGLNPAWFIYPSMPFAALMVFSYLMGQRGGAAKGD